jgi:uncharacterized protein
MAKMRSSSPRTTRVIRIVAAAALLSVAAAAKEVPYLSGRVNDTAGIIPETTRGQIEAKLKAYETESGAQVAVLTVDSLDGEVLEDYTHKVASTWQLGQKGKDNGVLFLVAKSDRKIRIEVGYGLEPQLTDAQSRRILDNVVRPKFRAGDFGGGIDAGVDAILGTLRGQAGAIPLESPPGGSSATNLADAPIMVRIFMAGMFFLVVGVFTVVAMLQKGCQGWFLYCFLIPFYFAFPTVFLGTVGGIILLAVYVVAFPILKLMLHQTPWGKGYLRSHPALTTFITSSSSGGWSSGGGWSGGGGFSGGGGSFGGGGASSSW